ncbi:MAG: GAF domain-containing protein, partial [Ardenticatenales bacterium]|nr:GAF domain-containing protein [Ardenticatenales bacterium]
ETANRRAWETCEPYSQTARVYHPEKEQWIWVHTASTPVSNADGKLTHFNGLIIDITEQKRAEEALQHQIAFESIITNISTAFINLAAADTDREINRALQAIGEFTGADRGHLVLFSADGAAMDCTHEWCAAGIEPQIERTKAVPISDLAWSTARLMQGEIVHLSRIADLPAEATAERTEFQVQCIRSLIAVPIAYRGAPFGFLRFDSVRSEKTWSEEGIALLKIAGEILANALEHRRGQAIRAGQSQFLELLATGGDFTETLHSLLRIIEEQWPGMLGLVLLVDEDGIHLHHGAAISLPEAYTQSIEGLEIGPMVGSCGTAVYSGKRVIVEDIATDPRWDGLRDLAVEYGLGACWSEPVFSSSGQVIATFAMYYHHARAPTEEELRAIELAAHLVGIAVEHRQAQEALQLAYQTLERRVDERTRELSMLLEVSHNVASTLELGPLLGLVLDQLKTVVDYTGATILALDEEALTVLAYRGLIPQKEALHLRYPLEQAHVNREVIHRREPVRIPDVRGDTSLARAFQETAGEQLQSTFDYIRSWMGVPLMVKERVVGMLALDHSEPNYYTTQQADLALAFANQVAVAMENARLYQRAQELAVVEERSRLARDLHDAVTQTLFSASLIAEVLPRLWERDPQEGQLRLGELRELTRGALAEMRTLLLELRPAALVDAELGDLLRQLAESITGRARVPVTVEMDGECVLLAEVKIALYRIAQEALNNVAKHADASQATVTLRCRPGEAELHVNDDGCGFDPAGISPESLGLGIMRERARVIGAEVDIESQVGRGTQVSVIWKDE